MRSERDPKPTKQDTPFIVDDRIKRVIAAAVAEVDPAQMAIIRKWTPAERVRQALGMIKAGEDAVAYRLRQRKPHLSETEALREVRMRAHANEERFKTWRKKK